MQLIASVGNLGTMVLPGKAGGGREKDICEMPEASLHPAALLSEAGRKQEGWRELCSALGNADNLGDPKHPQNSSLVPGMGRSCQCLSVLGLAFRFACAPSLHKFPFPVALQNACAAYEMEEIKLQDPRIGQALCNI